MKISVIIPIYNAEKHLKNSINSVLNQTYSDIELILVNDGSSDNSLNICKDYEKNDRRIILISIENSGPGAARNRGIESSEGEYLAFVDADDWLKNDALERLIGISTSGDYDIVSSNHFRVEDQARVSSNNYESGDISRNKSEKEKRRYHLFKTSSSFGYVWGKLYKSSFIKENNIKFIEEGKVFLEDNLFNLKAFSYNPKYYVLNEPLYYYSVYNDSVSNKREDITNRAMKMLGNYELFLDEKNIYDENLDLFVPLASRVLAWVLMKAVDGRLNIKIIHSRILKFSANSTIRRLFCHKESMKQLWKINSIIQTIFYSLILLCIRYKLEIILTLVFYISYPLSKIYIKKSLKT